MVLGYEKPVDIPMMSMYDKDMMKMYLGALQDDYKQGLADQKEFANNYNNFVSVMPGANEAYYNAGMKGINDEYDRLVKMGIDPIRSVEGRGRMAKARAAANIPLMNNIKADSAAYEQYQKAAGALAAEGKYDKNFNDWWLKKNGIDPNNWDFNGQRRWDVLSPVKTSTIEEMLRPTYEELAKTAYTRDEDLSKNGWIVDVVKPDSITKALNRDIDDLLKNPNMQYFYENSGLSRDDFMNNVLAQDLAGKLTPNVKPDEVYQFNQKMALERAKATEEARHHRNTEKPTPELPQTPTLTQKVEQRTQSALSQIDANAFQNYFETLAKNERNPKNKDIYKGYAKEWKAFANADPSTEAGQKARETFLRKYGYYDNNGLTQKFFTYSDKVHGAFRGNLTQTRTETLKNSIDSYYRALVPVTGSNEAETFSRSISGSSTKQKNGYYGVRFGKSMRYVNARALEYTGGTRRSSVPKDKDIIHQFDMFTRSGAGLSGNLFSTSSMSAGKLPGNVLEVSGFNVTVPYTKIDAFIDKAKSNRYILSDGHVVTSTTPDEKILSDLELSVVDRLGNQVSHSEATKDNETKITESWKHDKYVVIPSSKSFNGTGSNFSGINDDYFKTTDGSTAAYKETMNSLLTALGFNQ